MVALSLGVGACGFDATKPQVGTVGYIQGFAGLITAEEPRAVLVAQDVLTAGGSAVDSAVALAYALTATLPSRAGLGGGGSCVFYDHAAKATHAYHFPAQAPSLDRPGMGQALSVPGLSRGLFLMHARGGRLRWGQLVAPAENLARFGNQVSRALATDIAAFGDRIAGDPAGARVFVRDDGSLVGEGDVIVQTDLAGTLSRLRAQGPGDFYQGALARQIAEAALRVGPGLSFEDLRAYRPAEYATLTVTVGNETAHFPPPPSGGAVAAQVLSLLLREDIYDGADAAEKPHVIAEASLHAYVDRGKWAGRGGGSTVPVDQLVTPERVQRAGAGMNTARPAPPQGAPLGPDAPPSGTSFAVIDLNANAVACSIGVNRPFGTGKMLPGLGFFAVPAPDGQGSGAATTAPVVVVNEFNHEVWFAGAASGGATAATALAQVMARTLVDGEPVDAAIRAKRVHAGSSGTTVFVEHGAPAVVDGLKQRGHQVLEVSDIGRVGALHCPGGMPSHTENCTRMTDPRGHGLAVIVGEGW